MGLYAIWKDRDGKPKVSLVVANGPAEAVEAVAQKILGKYLDRGGSSEWTLDATYVAVEIGCGSGTRVKIHNSYGDVTTVKEEE